MGATTPPLTVTHRSVVTADQIDHLGHMNVRFYGVNAAAGTRAVVANLLGEMPHGVRVVDLYTRHHREQLLGAPLAVRSGIIDVVDDGLRIYHELVDETSDALAATFVHRVCIDVAGGGSLPVSVVARAANQLVEVPAHGATR